VKQGAGEKTWQGAVHPGAVGDSYFLSVSAFRTSSWVETDLEIAAEPPRLLEIYEGINAGQINSGSRAKYLKMHDFPGPGKFLKSRPGSIWNSKAPGFHNNPGDVEQLLRY
jgi:hypothetical protein